MTQGETLTVREVKTNVVRSGHEQVSMDLNIAGNNAGASSEENKPNRRQQVTAEEVKPGRQYTMAENFKRKQRLQDQRKVEESNEQVINRTHQQTAETEQNAEDKEMTNVTENEHEQSDTEIQTQDQTQSSLLQEQLHEHNCDNTGQQDVQAEQKNQLPIHTEKTQSSLLQEQLNEHNCDYTGQQDVQSEQKNQLPIHTEKTQSSLLQEQPNEHNCENTRQEDVQSNNQQKNTDLQQHQQQQEITEQSNHEHTILIHCEEIKDQQLPTVNNETFAYEIQEVENKSTCDIADLNSEAIENVQDTHTDEENKTVEDTDTDKEKANDHVQLKTLADLICLCRSRGLQIYNDKSNRPETDRLLYTDAELNKTDDRGSKMSKRHCSDDRTASERTKSSVKSRPSNDANSASTSSYYVRRDRLNTGTSLMTSTSYLSSRRESRLSVRSGTERRLVTEDVDADELLQQRMWKKSRRRREQKFSLLEVAKQKQQDIEATTIINHLKKTISKANMADTTAKCSVQTEEPTIRDAVFDTNVQEGGQESAGDSDRLSGVKVEERQQEHNLVEQLCKQVENNDSSDLTSEDTSEIQEFRIEDGNTTLILYKLKTNEIKNLDIRNELVARSRLPDKPDEVETGEASLMNNDSHVSNSNNQSEAIGCAECDTHVNNETASSQESQSGSCEDNLEVRASDNLDIAINTPGDDTSQVMNENSMDTQRRRRRFSQEDKHSTENLKSTDSGISSDSEKDSITQRHLNSVETSVNGEHKRNKGGTSVKNTGKNKDVLNTKTDGADMDNYKTRRADGKNSETDSKTSDIKTGHKKTKKSKRSLGNGFLVASDNEDDFDTDRAAAGSENHSLGTKSTRAKSEAVAFNEMSREARMVLLMAKIRQRYDEEKQTQSTYLQQLSDTRQHLRHEYKHLNTKIDPDPVPKAKNEEPPKPEVIKPKPKAKPAPESPRPKPVRKPPPRRKPAPIPEPPKEEEEEEEDAKPKKVVGSRIDCKWSPRHPLYTQIKSGFKSSIVIPYNESIPRQYRSVKQDRYKQWRASSVDDVYPNRDRGLSNGMSKGTNGVTTTRSVDDRHLHFADDEQATGVHSRLRKKRREFQEGYRPRSKSLHERISKNRNEEFERLQENDLNGIPTQAKVYNRNGSKQSKNPDIKPAKQQSDKNNPSTKGSLLNRNARNHVTTNGVISKASSYNSSRTLSRQTSRSVSTQTPSGEIPISLAVNIVQSRNRFYAENMGEEVTPREGRVARLFSDLQKVRQSRDTAGEPVSGEYSASSMNFERDASFLFMDYDKSSTPLDKRQSDRDLNDFLYRSINYEMCNKGRPLYVGPDRKERALKVLKNKVNNKMQFGTRVG